MSALWNWETCLPVGKRQRVAALQRCTPKEKALDCSDGSVLKPIRLLVAAGEDQQSWQHRSQRAAEDYAETVGSLGEWIFRADEGEMLGVACDHRQTILAGYGGYLRIAKIVLLPPVRT